MLQTTDQTPYSQYFKDTSVSHAALSHYFFGENLLKKEASEFEKGKLLFVVNPVSIDKSQKNNLNGSLMVIQQYSPHKEGHKDKLLKEIEKTIKQLRGKMLKDYNEMIINTDFGKFKYKEASQKEIGMEQFCGIKMDFNFSFHGAVKYDPDRWE